eukprot:8346403-Pyramimonas_sp.AAC.4
MGPEGGLGGRRYCGRATAPIGYCCLRGRECTRGSMLRREVTAIVLGLESASELRGRIGQPFSRARHGHCRTDHYDLIAYDQHTKQSCHSRTHNSRQFLTDDIRTCRALPFSPSCKACDHSSNAQVKEGLAQAQAAAANAPKGVN